MRSRVWSRSRIRAYREQRSGRRFLAVSGGDFTPTRIAAVTTMMLMPSPKRLMLGYLLGAYTTSITGGCVVFVLGGSRVRPAPPSTRSVRRRTSSSGCSRCRSRGCSAPVATSRFSSADGPKRVEAGRQAASKPTESVPLRMLGKGDPKVTFLVGALPRFPGASFLAAMNHIHKLGNRPVRARPYLRWP